MKGLLPRFSVRQMVIMWIWIIIAVHHCPRDVHASSVRPDSCEVESRTTLYCSPQSMKELLLIFESWYQFSTISIECDLDPRERVNLTRKYFQSNRKLTKLTLRRCNIFDLATGTFRPMPNLRVLTLNDNHIPEIRHGAFLGLANLQELYLERNRIESISPGAFLGLPYLRKLDLSMNQITAIKEGSFFGVDLEYLNLANSHIRYISPDAISGLGLQKLNFSGNMFDCSCSLRRFASWIRRNSHMLTGYLYCSLPSRMYGVPVVDYYPNANDCNPQTTAVHVSMDPPRPPGQAYDINHLYLQFFTVVCTTNSVAIVCIVILFCVVMSCPRRIRPMVKTLSAEVSVKEVLLSLDPSHLSCPREQILHL